MSFIYACRVVVTPVGVAGAVWEGRNALQSAGTVTDFLLLNF